VPKSIFKTLVICGPTASGKTSLALSVAKLLPRANILSVDSRQVYRELDIITGKDIPQKISPKIKIYGLNLIEGDEKFNLSDFVDYSSKVISESLAKSIPLIIVGGTGLYLKAITSNLLNVHVPPNPILRQTLEKKDLTYLQNLLSKINSEKYLSLNNSDRNNPRRLIRAIEITKFQTANNSGKVSLVLDAKQPTLPAFYWVGLKSTPETQKQNICRRVVERLKSGAIDEVKNLTVKYPDTTLPIYTSLGVREILKFLSGTISGQELIDLWTKAEIDYARRQTVWFKKQSGIIWYDKDSVDQALVSLLASKLIK